MTRTRNERGQVLVMTVIAMTVLLGMTAFVLDVGAWFHSKRQLQATADAAALAGAQALPDDPGTASQWALDYANKNGGGVLGADVTITSTNMGNDTIAITGKKTEPGFFSRILGVDNVDVKAAAKAIVGPPSQARYVAPMVVNCKHPLIQNCNGKNIPTFNSPTTLDFDPMGAPGAFGMLNLDGGSGTPGSSEEAAWILHGFDKYLPLGDYNSDPGAKFSSQNIQGALDARIGTELLFPVFKTLNGQGQNAQYDIIGWIGFHLTSYVVHGNNSTLSGYFTQYIAQGILAQSGGGGGSGAPGTFGVKSIQLIG
jgi:Putative Flp pilus-assembly TadE/G-like